MNTVLAIARREWRAQFASPLAWSLLALWCAVAAWLLLTGIEDYAQLAPRYADRPDGPGVTDLVIAPLLANLAGLCVFVLPLVTLRSIVGERRDGTLPLLFAAGASGSRIALGKWLGALAVPAAMLALVAAMVLSLSVGTPLDLGKLGAGLAGLGLLMLALVALGVLCSSLAQHPAGGAMAAMAAGTFGWFADAAARQRGTVDGLVNWLALPSHLTAPMRGVLATVDVAYFLLLAVLCLGLAALRIDRLRELG